MYDYQSIMKTTIFLVIATALWGINFHFGKAMVQESPAMVAGFWRYLLAVIALFAFSINKLPPWQLLKENSIALLLVGVVGLFGFNFFFFVGIQYTSAINAVLIMGLNPTLTLILSYFILKTKVLPSQVLGLSVAFIGVIFLITKGNINALGFMEIAKGDFYILLANIVFALHHVLVKKYHGRLTTMNFTLATNVICLLAFAFIIPFQGVESIINYSSSYWLSAIGIGVFGTALAYYLWNVGVGDLGADRAGVFMNVAPLAAVLASPFFGEQLYAYHLFSFVIIVTGVVIMQLKKKI